MLSFSYHASIIQNQDLIRQFCGRNPLSNHQQGAVTQLLDSLLEKDLLEKFQDNQDKRVFYIALSKSGRKHFKHVRKHGGKRALKLFDVLTDEEVAQFEIITSKLAQEFNEEC